MLFAATSINYMDRQVIGLLKGTLETSIGLTESQFGYIVAGFQAAYAVGLLAAGRLVDRLGSKVGYALVIGVWSVAAMAHGLVRSAVGFGVARVALGLGEAGNFPAAIKAVAEWFPKRERALATGIFNSGANVGAVVAPALIPWLTLKYGWQASFLWTGAAGFVWLAWWLWRYRGVAGHPTLTGAELEVIQERAAGEETTAVGRVPWVRLLPLRQTWVFAGAKFLTDPIWYFYLFWLPGYFDRRFHLGLSHLGLPLIVVYNVSAVGSVAGGWLPAGLERLGLRGSRVRYGAMLVCALGAVPMLWAAGTRSEWMAVALMSLATAAHQGWSANLYTTVTEMFPSTAVGSVTGIGGMAGSVGGVLLSVYTGRVLERTHSYAVLFGMAASVYLLALGMMVLLVPRLRRIDVSDLVTS